MTAKEKAKELYENMYYCTDSHSRDLDQHKSAVKSALICCNEIIYYTNSKEIKYWQEVKQEIKKI